MTYHGFKTYAEMVSFSMTSQKNAEVLFSYLRLLNARRDAENSIIKEAKTKHPGLSAHEVLKRYNTYLEKTYPVPSFN